VAQEMMNSDASARPLPDGKTSRSRSGSRCVQQITKPINKFFFFLVSTLKSSWSGGC